MCGIAGALSLGREIADPDRLDVERMTAVLGHRGPNRQGMFCDSRSALGNARLNVIDLSPNASLPMSNAGRTVWIVYNGEVSNFRELKSEFKLEEKYRFCSSTDTEVLIHLYEELGIDFIHRLSGMFAFCLYDTRIGKAYVVRDFYGINPLFYMVRNQRLYFASEIKAFLELPDFEPGIDHEAVFHYFSLAYIPGKHTGFEEISELQGGSLIEINFSKASFHEREYYRPRYEQDLGISEREAAEKVHELMLDSVRRNLISDVPVGMTLSGGVDTSTILGLVKELGQSRGMHTFSIKMGSQSFDESRYQRLMAQFAGSNHHEISIGPQDVLDVLVEHAAYIDEPCGDGSAIPSYILARTAKKYVTVLLSGEGGDEIFNAYETHGAYKWRKLYRSLTPAFLRRCIRALAARLPTDYRKLSFDFMLKRFTQGAEMGVAQAHLFWRHVLTESEKCRLMPGHTRYPRTDSLFADLFNSLDFDDDLNRITLLDIKFFFIGDLMVKNDRMFMAHSLEGRFPYMDRKLVEYVSALPVNMRIKGFKRRYIEKLAMKGRIPKQILQRSNFGLEMPHSIWFLDEFKDTALRYFAKKNIARTDFLDHKAVENLWQEHISGRKDNGRALWCILQFLIWFDLFVYNKDYKKYLSFSAANR